eukprot:scaffold281127_cov24-Tisochrysis_lutea.AAC.2
MQCPVAAPPARPRVQTLSQPVRASMAGQAVPRLQLQCCINHETIKRGQRHVGHQGANLLHYSFMEYMIYHDAHHAPRSMHGLPLLKSSHQQHASSSSPCSELLPFTAAAWCHLEFWIPAAALTDTNSSPVDTRFVDASWKEKRRRGAHT